MGVHKTVSFSVVILLITVLFAGAVTVPAAAQYDTMQFRYNAEHTGDYSPVAGPVPSNGQLLWNCTAGGGSPAVVNGVVYVGGFAIYANNGTELWHYEGGYGSPAVVNGVLYLANETHVYALNATTGTKLWNFTTPGSIFSSQSSPAVANGVVYVGCGDNNVGSNSGNVYAIYANNGTKLWNFTTRGGVMFPPTVANGIVYAGSAGADNNLYALYASNGTKLWNYTAGDAVWGSPAVANGVVYVGSYDGNLYALYASNGTKLWNYTTRGVVPPSLEVSFTSPAVANGVVYVGDLYGAGGYTNYRGSLYAIYANNGTEFWNFTTAHGVASPPAVANGVVYVGGYLPGDIFALDANNGTELWNYLIGNSNSYPTMGTVTSSPAVVNGVVFVGSEDDNFCAIGNNSTALNAGAPSTVSINQNFTVNGTLSGSTFGVADANITLQRSTDNVTFSNLTNATTDTSGSYQFSQNESAAGIYYYRTAYDGNATYTNATSNIVSVTVSSLPTTPTTLTVTAPSTASINKPFTINGTLNITASTPVAGATIQLQKNVSGTWTNVTGKTNTTTSTGAYRISTSELTAGKYQYRTTYAGNDTYAGTNSGSVTVTVNKIPTQLSASVNPTTVYQQFTVNGTLNTTDGTPIAGATIQLQKNVSGTWTNVATNVTNETGGYAFSQNEIAVGVYYYRTTYAGNDTYANATSNVVSVLRPVILTQLSAAANLTSVVVNQNFTINGTLNTTGGTPIAGATIQLQKNVSGTWTNVMTNVTDSTGGYQFSQNESANGTYYYRTAYDGNDTHANATSNTVSVTVFAASRLSTTLNATVSSKFVAVNKQFSINGTLSAGTTSLAGATITLQRSTNNATWNNVTNTATNGAGQYQFSRSESTAHAYYYRTSYDGNATYANATSNVVSVKVVSKASILADLNTLSLAVLGTPSSAFIPGTKIATLAVIGATKVNFMVGSYGGATTELKSALLPRTDGCAKTGKPDSDDWVRTCAAQGQLYPQVQNLIQELQALQGS
jgi:outer membrane protein assembly factor BamB